MAPSIGFKQHTMIAVLQETRNEPQNQLAPNSEFLQKRIFIFSNDMLSFWINSSRFVQILWKLLVTFYSLLPLSLCYLACWAAGQTSWDTKCSIRIGEARNLFFRSSDDGLHFGLKKSNWSQVVWIDHKWSCLNINMCQRILSNLIWSQAWRRWKAERDPSSPASLVPSCQVEWQVPRCY